MMALDVIKRLRALLAKNGKAPATAEELEAELEKARQAIEQQKGALFMLEARRADALLFAEEPEIRRVDDEITSTRIRVETLDALLPRLVVEVEVRRADAEQEALARRAEQLRKRRDKLIVWHTTQYPEHAWAISCGVADEAEYERDLRGLQCDVEASGHAVEVPHSLRVGPDELRPELVLGRLWDGGGSLRLPSPFSRGFDFWPRDSRLSRETLFTPPAPEPDPVAAPSP
jgi:hypothetical protein